MGSPVVSSSRPRIIADDHLAGKVPGLPRSAPAFGLCRVDSCCTGSGWYSCTATTLNSSMNTSRGAGKYQTPSPIQCIDEADVPIVFASLLWTKLISDNIQRRVDNISRQFTGAGWKDLPQELVNEILGYLLDDLAALKACSLTCKYLFGATRPLIHKWLCLASRQDQKAHPEPKGSLFGRRKRVPEAFERLVGADRSGLLRYTRHLTFEMESDSFSLRNIQEYLPRLRSITELHTLTLITPRAYLFIQVFAEYFGIFTNTLRHLDLDIRNAHGAATAHQFLHIICQFPLLEDLSIVSPDKAVVHPGYPVSTITWSPPFRGKLLLAQMYPGALSEGLATLPGGLHFRSLELIWCRCPGIQAVLAASSGTVASVSYLWPVRDSGYSESNPSISRILLLDCWGP